MTYHWISSTNPPFPLSLELNALSDIWRKLNYASASEPSEAEAIRQALEEMSSLASDTPGLVFPTLTADQRKFAVNPAFKSFYDTRFRKIEGVEQEEPKTGNK